MRVWMVHGRPPSGRKGPRLVLLRDGFCWPALLVPTLWFLGQGLLALALLHAAMLVAVALLLPGAAAGFAVAGLNLFLGFEARNLQGWWLRLRGFRQEAVVVARDEDAAFLNLATFRPDLARAAA